MKKVMSLLLALTMCVGLCVPAFAQETEPPLPPWVNEGETWVPANGIMPLEDDSCPKGHWRPNGYLYQGYTTGNSALEGFLANGAVGLMGLVPGLGPIALTVTMASAGAQLLYAAQHGGRIQGRYVKYVYTSGRSTWYHTVWLYDEDGWGQYLDCAVTTDFYG